MYFFFFFWFLERKLDFLTKFSLDYFQRWINNTVSIKEVLSMNFGYLVTQIVTVSRFALNSSFNRMWATFEYKIIKRVNPTPLSSQK